MRGNIVMRNNNIARKHPFDSQREQRMNDAIKEVKELRKVAEKFGLSKSSIERYIHEIQ